MRCRALGSRSRSRSPLEAGHVDLHFRRCGHVNVWWWGTRGDTLLPPCTTQPVVRSHPRPPRALHPGPNPPRRHPALPLHLDPGGDLHPCSSSSRPGRPSFCPRNRRAFPSPEGCVRWMMGTKAFRYSARCAGRHLGPCVWERLACRRRAAGFGRSARGGRRRGASPRHARSARAPDAGGLQVVHRRGAGDGRS